MCRIVAISDTHNLHNQMKYNINDYISPNDYNILIHSGDCTNRGTQSDITDFVYWFMNIKGFDEKIFIAGNHDFGFEMVTKPHHKGDFDWYYNLMNEENLSQSDVTYLLDDSLVINLPNINKPIKIYGSPWQPTFHNWAFNLDRFSDELKSVWDKIPDDTDILITHGPPNQVLDRVDQWGTYRYVGCELLRNRILDLNVTLHIFGHIHEGYGYKMLENTLCVNPSICNRNYKPINKPIAMDLIEENNKLKINFI